MVSKKKITWFEERPRAQMETTTDEEFTIIFFLRDNKILNEKRLFGKI
jgi:hypothetical protein